MTDTIAAIATPPGQGGVGIVRVSGPHTVAIAASLLGKTPAPRMATFATFRDAAEQPLDEGLALYFPAPNSFTGEHVLELQGHGGPVVMDRLLKRCVELGARLARPGEFSERAFLNGKLDLAQAEAIADLIASQSEAAASAAMRSLQGEFSAAVHVLVEQLIQLRLYVEAAIDFPEEEIDFLADGVIENQTAELLTAFTHLSQQAQQGRLLRDGLTVVLAGPPNAGKSSLLNQLAGVDAAIVTNVPGTTRDVLRERIHLDGLPLHIIDTAGLRAAPDVVEREGIRRAQVEIAQADRILLLQGDDEPAANLQDFLPELAADLPITRIRNKIDLSGHTPQIIETTSQTEIYLSAKTGAGLDLLREHLKASLGFQAVESGQFLARRRHLEALAAAQASVEQALAQLRVKAGELAADDLRQAQQQLNEITGEFTADDLLGRIFGSFCIGK